MISKCPVRDLNKSRVRDCSSCDHSVDCIRKRTVFELYRRKAEKRDSYEVIAQYKLCEIKGHRSGRNIYNFPRRLLPKLRFRRVDIPAGVLVKATRKASTKILNARY